MGLVFGKGLYLWKCTVPPTLALTLSLTSAFSLYITAGVEKPVGLSALCRTVYIAGDKNREPL